MTISARINLRDLSAALAVALDTPKGVTYDALSAIFESISDCALKGIPVSIHGFGTFKAKIRKARAGRHPQTGAAIRVPESKTLGFKAVPSLKSVKGRKK